MIGKGKTTKLFETLNRDIEIIIPCSLAMKSKFEFQTVEYS